MLLILNDCDPWQSACDFHWTIGYLWRSWDWFGRATVVLLVFMATDVLMIACNRFYRYSIAGSQSRNFLRDTATALRDGRFDDAIAIAAKNTFSKASLKGSYSFLLNLWTNNVNTNQFAVVGILTFDGAGNVAGSYTSLSLQVFQTGILGGTYTVNSNGTGTITKPDGPQRVSWRKIPRGLPAVLTSRPVIGEIISDYRSEGLYTGSSLATFQPLRAQDQRSL